LCPKCCTAASKGEIPKICVAKGDDYGNWDNIPGWEPLTYVEELMISRHVAQISLFKLTQKGRGGSSTDQMALKGHTIVFNHNGLANLEERLSDANILPRKSVDDFIAVTFIGKAAFEDVKSAVRSTRTFSISKKRITLALRVLKDVNPYYASVAVDEDWNEEELQASIHASIIKSMRTDASNDLEALDTYTSQNTASDVQPSSDAFVSTDEVDCQAIMVGAIEGISSVPGDTAVDAKAVFIADAVASFRESREDLEESLSNEVFF
jgi:hypothetical protein